jgi:hypothetical protein
MPAFSKIQKHHVEGQSDLPHWEHYLSSKKVCDYRVAIPSFDRPQHLCDVTLTFLKSHGVPMNKVTVFVSPTSPPGSTTPEWFRYLSTLREAGFADVEIRPGGHGLENQLAAAMEWGENKYMIVMCDTVRDVKRAVTQGGKTTLVSIPQGSLVAIWHHAHDLMLAADAQAWSFSASHRADFMVERKISRRLGFLDGNCMGMLVPEDWKKFRVQQGHGMIYHVELSAAMWHNGYRFVRYCGLCVDHPYRRPGGQASVFTNAVKRRALENAAVKKVAKMYPECVEFLPKPQASLNNMQYRFKRDGDEPLTMKRFSLVGRPRKHKATAASSSAERMRIMRKRAKRGVAKKAAK